MVNEAVGKAERIVAEAVGQARGTVQGLGFDAMIADIEAAISKNPLISVIVAAAVGATLTSGVMRRRR
jgi:hypothetical protein